MKKLVFIIFLSLFLAVNFASADYTPSKEFFELMKALVEKAPEVTNRPGGYSFKGVQSGKPFQAGKVAYFYVFSNGEVVMQLEEWDLRADGNFNVTYWKFYQNYTQKWERIIEGTHLVSETPVLNFPVSDEATEKSELCQKLLMKLAPEA